MASADIDTLSYDMLRVLIMLSHYMLRPFYGFSKHILISDAQATYTDLVTHCTCSVKASLNQSQLMMYITMAHIGTDWHGSAASFCSLLAGQDS